MSPFNIFPVDDTQLEALQTIARETFFESYHQQNTPENMASYLATYFNLERLGEELSNPESFFFFTQKQGENVGYIKLNIGKAQTEQELPNALEIERIYVRSPFQRRGIGKEMLHHAYSFAKSKAISMVWLGVWEENSKAIAFYESQGFEKFGKHLYVVGNEDQWDWMMRREV